MLYNFIKPLANLSYNITKRFEKKLGYRVSFNLPKGWINGLMTFDMTSVWKKYGIDAKGINYFSIGHIKNNLSTRFVPNSKYYQAWLGGYLVKFSGKRNWDIKEHFKLAKADQLNWLKLYGDPEPLAKVQHHETKLIKK